MSSSNEELLSELQTLTEKGFDLIILEKNCLEDGNDYQAEGGITLEIDYQTWYTTALGIVELFIPSRANDFQTLYKAEKRTRITSENYTIRDYLIGHRLTNNKRISYGVFSMKFRNQIGILVSVASRLSSRLNNIQSIIQADLFDNELDTAEELLKNGHIRPAGVLAGVTLEGHLDTVCKNHAIKIAKKNPTISTYNEALKSKEIYEVEQWRRIQLLGDLRNKCAHKNTTEPTKEDAQDLIDGVKKIIKTVF